MVRLHVPRRRPPFPHPHRRDLSMTHAWNPIRNTRSPRVVARPPKQTPKSEKARRDASSISPLARDRRRGYARGAR